MVFCGDGLSPLLPVFSYAPRGTLLHFQPAELSQRLRSNLLANQPGDFLKAEKAKKLTVSDLNLKKTAIRLLGQKLVSNEVLYIQRNLGATATQEQLDQNVIAVRKLPWATIAIVD
jgi:hypothetical protein